jgi:hypothetical protein
MIWILATRGASTKLRLSPYTETEIEGVHSVVYKPGIYPFAVTGAKTTQGEVGTYLRGVNEVSGYVFSYHGLAAETLFAIEDPLDLIVRYRANGQNRKRTFLDMLFIGYSTVTVPSINAGVPELVGVPFRVQIPYPSDKLADHITDTADA